MPHIDLPDGVPGILGPMAFRPETAVPLSQLAEVLLRGPSTLSRGERELIATSVSRRNRCRFCERSHAAFAARQLDGGHAVVAATLDDPEHAPVTPKLRALLAVAHQVQEGGRAVTAEAVAAARLEGATDVELHDTVLIAAAFCMYNRYVDGLGAWTPAEPDAYEGAADVIVERGYGAVLV
jgi:uncharacterized peroxidase-related enzyme